MDEKIIESVVEAGDRFIKKYIKQNVVARQASLAFEEDDNRFKRFFKAAGPCTHYAVRVVAADRAKKETMIEISLANGEITQTQAENKKRINKVDPFVSFSQDAITHNLELEHHHLGTRLKFESGCVNEELMGKFVANDDMITAIREYGDEIEIVSEIELKPIVLMGDNQPTDKGQIHAVQLDEPIVSNYVDLIKAAQKYDTVRKTHYSNDLM